MTKRVWSYAIVAVISAAFGAVSQPLAQLAVLAQPECQTFETGKSICGKFFQYWRAHGGLPQQGLPISNEFVEVSDLDGKPYRVQYFERAVFEMHPENQPPYDVLLSQLGTLQFNRKYPAGDPSMQTPLPAPAPSSYEVISVENANRVQESKVTNSDSWVGCVEFAPKSSIVAWAGDGDIWVYDVDGEQVLKRLPGHDGLVHTAVFSPDGARLYSGGLDTGGGRIRIWDWRAGAELWSVQAAPPGWGASINISPDGRWLGSSGHSQVTLWQVAGDTLQQFAQLGQGSQPSISSEGWVAHWKEGGVRLYKIDSGESRLLAAPDAPGYDPVVAFSPDGSLVAAGAWDHSVRLWRVSDGQPLSKGQGHTAPIPGVAFSPDGQVLATASFDGTVRLWKVADGTLLRILQGHISALKVAFSPDGRTLVSGAHDQTVRLWRVR